MAVPTVSSLFTGQCAGNAVRCPDGTCFPAAARCDGQSHCTDGSDEPASCGRRSREEQSLFIYDWLMPRRENLLIFFNFNAAFFLDDDPRFTSDRENLLRRQRRLQPRVCRWSQRSTMCLSCRLWALYQLDRLSRCVCVCVSVSKSITILIYRGFHLESNFDEPYISFCLGVVSQFGINKVHIYLLLPSVWIVNMTF